MHLKCSAGECESVWNIMDRTQNQYKMN